MVSEKFEYCNRCEKSPRWFPNKNRVPWRRVEEWVPHRIAHLNDVHKIPATIRDYRKYISRKPANPNISLVLNNLRLEARGRAIVYSCNVCNKILQVDKLKECRCLDPRFIVDFYREQKAIEETFLEEAQNALGS